MVLTSPRQPTHHAPNPEGQPIRLEPLRRRASVRVMFVEKATQGANA